MKHLSLIVSITGALARPTMAHYIFSKLVLNGEVSKDWQYIRQTTRSECYMPTKFTSTYDDLTPNDSDFRCNLGSFSNAANTEVAEVAAGETIAMKLFYDGNIAHPGPGQVYMSKAPTGNVQEYEGDGEWFKVWESTLCDESGDLTSDAWCTYGMSQFEFQIPEATPSGEYLVRAEHIGLHGAQVDEAEFFYSCAQIKVTGGGNGSPSLTYQIPGIYNNSMTLFNGLNLWVDSAETIELDILDTPIADEVWQGTAEESTVSATSHYTASSTSISITTSAPAVEQIPTATADVGFQSSVAAESAALLENLDYPHYDGGCH
ncbi:glycosyl hydrolase family 61-domain-containing protein [Aspergillus pseudodeflectus]|uniref:AA9 family lytic polysaccharide monooxygenase n=1 Tax=Aspergillus pseudodeflectus TaxID=176178 RepID=A0ABR4KSB8_9EURO